VTAQSIDELAPPHTRILRLFGVPHVTRGGRRAEIPDGSKRLVAFTALHPRGVERQLAAGTLWPQGDEARASGNLRSALWRLKQARLSLLRVADGVLVLAGDVSVDAHLARQWAARLINGSPDQRDLSVLPGRTHELDLLPGWYDDWALIERERIRQRMLHGLEALSRRLVTVGRYADAVEAALVAVAIEPLRETAQEVLLEAHLAEGNRVEAVRALQGYRRQLRSELGVEPGPRLCRLLTSRGSLHYSEEISGPHSKQMAL